MNEPSDPGSLPRLSERAGLFYLWSMLASFNIVYILNIWLLDRTNQKLIKVFHFDDTWESAPIFMLSFGSLVTLASFVSLIGLAKRSDGATWAYRMPPLWVDIDPAVPLGKFWRTVCAVLALGLPFAAHVHFWRRFDEWQAWKNEGAYGAVSLWERVPLSMIFDWDAHRYGDLSKRLLSDDGFGGVSYLPFWQPVLMIVLTALVVAFGLRACMLVFAGPRTR